MIKESIFTFLIFCSVICNAQMPASDSVSKKIAWQLTKAFSLSSVQESQLLEINKTLAKQKLIVWSSYSSKDSIELEVQRIEGTRDSLYKAILMDKYNVYKEKKRSLVNNN